MSQETVEHATESEPNQMAGTNETVLEGGTEAVGNDPATPPDRRAHDKVEKARSRIESADREVEECLEKIGTDLERFETYEKERLEPLLRESRRLLGVLGSHREEYEDLPKALTADLEAPAESVEIPNLSSGKGGAFVIGLLATALALVGWWLFGARESGTPLWPGNFDLVAGEKVAEGIDRGLGLGGGAAAGLSVAIVSSLILGMLLYWALVRWRAARNLRLAERAEEESLFYCRKKEECKEKMKEVREHLAQLMKTARKYEVLLDEKNAALRRAIHIEESTQPEKLHPRTREDLEQMRRLAEELERLLHTPLAESGVLTSRSVEALRQANKAANDYLLKLYA